MKIGILIASNNEIISSEKNDFIKTISSQLFKNGFEVVSKQFLKAKSEAIISAIKQSLDICDCTIFVCENDAEKSYMSKKIIADIFNAQVNINSFAKSNVDEYARNSNIPLKKEDLTYAQIPSVARCIKNSLGVFQGFLIENVDKVLFFLPINYAELSNMFFSSVLPYLIQKSNGTSNSSYVFKTFGIKLNEMQLLLKDMIKNKHNIEVVCNEYLLCGEIIVNVPRIIRSEIVNNFVANIYSKILPYVYADSDNNFSEIICSLLSITNKTLAFAEDFTSGKLTSSFFEGSDQASKVLKESYIVPTNDAKIKILGVESSIFKKSKIDFNEIAYQMALGLLENSQADIVVANCGSIDDGNIVFAIGSTEGIHIFNQKVEGDNVQKIRMACHGNFFQLIKKIKQNDFHLGQTTV